MATTSIIIPDDLKARIEYRAGQNCRSFSGEVIFILKTYLRVERDIDIDAFKELVGSHSKG